MIFLHSGDNAKFQTRSERIKNIIYISGFSIGPLHFNATPLKNPLILSFKNQTMGGTFPKNLFYDFVAECVHIVMGIMTFIYLEIG